MTNSKFSLTAILVICIISTSITFYGCKEKQTSINSEEQNFSLNEGERLLFVGSYTRKEGHVDGQSEGIYSLVFNTENGSLRSAPFNAKATNPSYIFVDSPLKKVYAVNEIADDSKNGGGQVSSFQIELEKGVLTPINQASAVGGAPCYITKTNNEILVANYVSGNIGVIPVSDEGQLEEMSQVISFSGKGVTPRQESPHAHMIIKNPHTDEIFATDLGTDSIRIFELNSDENKLVRKGGFKVNDGSGPRHLDFHPTKNIVYIINELYGSVDVYAYINEEYSHLQNITSTLNSEQTDARCADIHVHPNGQYLFASNRGAYNSIMSYRIAEDGTLKIIAEKSAGVTTPRAFTLDPSGKYLLVAGQDAGGIVVFEIDQKSGRLLDINQKISVPTPVCLKWF